MSKIHIKGRILQYLENRESIWDYEIADMIMAEYKLSGDYWKGTIRALLADLYSCGLIESSEENLDDGSQFGLNKVLFRYNLTDFGRDRMCDTGLLQNIK